ncbi:hypothetical protein [Paenibacillus marinisediminis]
MNEEELIKNMKRRLLNYSILTAAIVVTGISLIMSMIYELPLLTTLSQALLATILLGIAINCAKLATQQLKSHNWKLRDIRFGFYFLYFSSILNATLALIIML